MTGTTESFPCSTGVLIVLQLHYLTRVNDGPFCPSIHSPFLCSYGIFLPSPIPVPQAPPIQPGTWEPGDSASQDPLQLSSAAWHIPVNGKWLGPASERADHVGLENLPLLPRSPSVAAKGVEAASPNG